VPIEHIHTFLVHAGRVSGEVLKINGARVELKGKIFGLMNSIYAHSDVECETEIAFNNSDDGTQTNPCRNLIVQYVVSPTLLNGRRVAERLEQKTDRRSGIGLLFLIVGAEGREKKIVLSRFPTDTAILAEESAQDLNVEFLERVFMKSATSYKAAVYRDTSTNAGFWSGFVVDRQMGTHVGADYWVGHFLASDFKLTAAAGTRRLATALRSAARKSSLEIKQEIASAVTLAGRLRKQNMSVKDFGDKFNLSPEAMTAVHNELKTQGAAVERFQFDAQEFNSEIGYRSIELSNGGILTAESAEFDSVFHQEVVNPAHGLVRISTEGQIVEEKFKKTS
jgi:hypothetical protein